MCRVIDKDLRTLEGTLYSPDSAFQITMDPSKQNAGNFDFQGMFLWSNILRQIDAVTQN